MTQDLGDRRGLDDGAVAAILLWTRLKEIPIVRVSALHPPEIHIWLIHFP
jgi:hypothetical protein